MSNSKTNINPISLQGELNLNSFKAEIHDFKGWNKKNGLNYGGLLSPFYSKNEANTNNVKYIDKVGNQYYMTNGTLSRKDSSGTVKDIMTYSTGKILKKTLLENDTLNQVVSWDYDADNDVFYWIEKRQEDIYTYYVVRNSKNDFEAEIDMENYGSEYEWVTETPICKVFAKDTLVVGFVNERISYIGIYYISSRYWVTQGFSYGGNFVGILKNSGIVFKKTSDNNDAVVIATNMGYMVGRINGVTILKSKVQPTITRTEDGVTYTFKPFDYSLTEDGTLVNLKGFYTDGSPNTDLCGGTTLGTVTETSSDLTLTVEEIVKWDVNSFTSSIFNSAHGASFTTKTTEHSSNIASFKNFLHTAKTTIADNNNFWTGAVFYRTGFIRGTVKTFFDYDGENVNFNDGVIYINTAKYGPFRLLYNNETLTGISVKNQNVPTYITEDMGTLLTPWYSIKDSENQRIVIADNRVVYKDIDNNIIALVYVSEKPEILNVLDNRYILINTDDYYNVYDIEKEVLLHFANDWNNRGNVSNTRTLTPDEKVTQTDLNSYDSLSLIELLYDFVYHVSAINPFFEQTNFPFTSMLVNPIGGFTIFEVFQSNGLRLPGPLMYDRVLYFSQKKKDDSVCYLHGYPEDSYPIETSGNILLNMPLFFSLNYSGLNLNLITMDGKTYTQFVYNNQLLYDYYLLSQIEGLTSVFVIFGQIYGVLNDKIVSMQVNNGVFQSSEFIVNVSNLQFIGATPYQAFFYSPFNRSIYVFTGDRQMSLLFNATSLTDIYSFKYNPSNNALFWNTNLGLIIIENNEACLLPGININDIYFLEDRFAIVNDLQILEYAKNEIEGFEILPLDLETAFYGASETMLSIIDTWYLRFVSENHEAGRITLSVKTWTDVGTESEEVNIDVSETDWDELTDSYYLRFQPSEQRGVGISLCIKSPFAIASIGAGFTPDTTMNSANNA